MPEPAPIQVEDYERPFAEFIDGFVDYRTWEQFIEAVFNTTVPEFEAGLNVYVGEKYGWTVAE